MLHLPNNREEDLRLRAAEDETEVKQLKMEVNFKL